jgi:hypothetical protein
MTDGQSLAEGAAGIALWHLEAGRWDAALEALRLATADGVSVSDNASLYYGAPAVAFVLAACDRPTIVRAKATACEATVILTRRRLCAAHGRIDQRKQPPYAEFDLIRGLTGLGVVLRRVGNDDVLREVLTYLVRLTEPIGGLPGWWCHHRPHRTQSGPPGGHSNHGIAHGITGPLALLALTFRDGTTVNGHAEAINRICQWLDTWQRHTDIGRPWWPQTINLDDLRNHEPSQSDLLRPSWCYGTPGIARAQQLAALALGDLTRQHLTEQAFNSCVNDAAQISQLTDRSLCHGTAGLLTVARRIAGDALTPIALPPLWRLHHQTAAAADEPAGFLEGAAGAALAAATTAAASWDACLLLI